MNFFKLFEKCVQLSFLMIWSHAASQVIGLVGGQGEAGNAYAALIASNGSITKISLAGLPTGASFLQSVALNQAGQGLVGGGGQNHNPSC